MHLLKSVVRLAALFMVQIPGAAADAQIVPSLVSNAAATKLLNADSAATLKQALAMLVPGARIELRSGNYGALSLRNFKNSGAPVTITSAPGQSARFSSADLTGSSGIRLHNLEFVGAANPLINFSLGSNIVLTGTLVSGASTNLDPWDDANTGIWIRNASRITLSGNMVQDLRIGAYVQRSSKIAIAENTVRFVREGINATAVDGIWVHRNAFAQFSPRFQDAEHPDAIQFWTSGEAVGNANILITENFMNFGGKRAIQGVFIRSEQADTYGKPHIVNRNVRIVGNVYYGSSRHGISLSSVVDGMVRNNMIIASPWADQNNAAGVFDQGRSGGGLQPAILIRRPVNVQIHRNAAPLLMATESGGTFFDNLDVWDTLQKKDIAVRDVLANPPSSDLPPISAFQIRIPSIAFTRSIGTVSLPRPGPQTTLDQMIARGAWYQSKADSISALNP